MQAASISKPPALLCQKKISLLQGLEIKYIIQYTV